MQKLYEGIEKTNFYDSDAIWDIKVRNGYFLTESFSSPFERMNVCRNILT